MRKTVQLFKDRTGFKVQLDKDLDSFEKRCKRQNLMPCVRMNGFSDLPWHKIFPDIFERDIQFYDYTKHVDMYQEFLEGKLPPNLYLTYSRSELNDKESLEFLRKGGNVAVVFHKVPEKWKRFRVIQGDDHDLRFLDPKPRVVGLVAKGRAKKVKEFVL